MQEPTIPSPLSLRRAIVNLIGFAVGLGLFIWIVVRAIERGDWHSVAKASPWLIALLLGSTLVSAAVNGAMFWITIRPIKHLRLMDLERLNLVASLLNYAPLRLGAIMRVLYHLRVDRLTLLQIGAWFSMQGYILLLAVGSSVLATLLHDRVDLFWLGLVVGQMVLGGWIGRIAVSHPLIVKHGRGIDRMLKNPWSLWGCSGLRLIDLAAFTARMAAALAILEIEVPATDAVILAMVALLSSLIPFGRLGFREFCVSAVLARLSPATQAADFSPDQLALIESAGEVLVFLPLGTLALLWFRARWRAAPPLRNTARTAEPTADAPGSQG